MIDAPARGPGRADRDRGTFPPLPRFVVQLHQPDRLQGLHDEDKVLVIDTARRSLMGGHIPGAINVPLSAWEKHLPRLKATRKVIVAYCA